MKVLVIGSGGREHALAWKLKQSKEVTKIYIAPGNAGCAEVGECIDLDLGNITSVARWAKTNNIDLVIPGPESVLCAGIVDACTDAGVLAFGPTKSAAELEKSKIFSKTLMRTYNIPTAEFAVFEQYNTAMNYLDMRPEGPVVVKADGLCAGKGVIVCKDLDEARDAVDRLMNRQEFLDAGHRIVIEELLRGQEVTVLALTDGKTIMPLATSQDHKTIFDNDEGDNTGGMGAYSPVPSTTLSPKLMDEIISRILVPTIHAMNNEGRRYKGILYAGLMLTNGGPKVLEYNVRFGDPETQPLMLRLESDLFSLLYATANNKLGNCEPAEWKKETSLCVVATAAGYPGDYRKGDIISGLDAANNLPNTVVFHAGTKKNNKGEIVSNGGRVLGITSLGGTIDEAISNTYNAVKLVNFTGMHYRNDIGKKALTVN